MTDVTKTDFLIIGAGPAGMAAAIYAGRADLKTLVLEKMMVGGQVANTMDIANYPGFPDSIDGPTLADKMKAQAEKFGAEFVMAEAQSLTKDGSLFRVVTSDGEIEARCVVLSTGSDPRELGVPGERELRGRGVSYCGTCDAPFFRNKKVFVIGGGDTALKEGLHLAKFASSVTIVHRRDELRGEKIYQHQVLAHEKIGIIWDSVLTEIRGDKKVETLALENVKTDAKSEQAADGVFIFVGTKPNTQLLQDILPEYCGEHVKTGEDMMTAVPGLFAVGDVREGSYRQVATAVGEGATAAMAAEHYLSH